MAVCQNLAGATASPGRGLGRPLWIVVAILKSRHPRGTMTTETHPLDMATMGRDNSLGTIVTTMDSSVIARPIKIVQIIQTTGIRIKIETSFEIILITTISNTITIVYLLQILTSKPIRDITPVEIKIMRDSTRDSQYNDQEVEENSSPSSIYTKYLQPRKYTRKYIDSYVVANRLSARPEHKLRRV